ncbi:GNAT family N-acetyltransferase, partial [Clostridium perfringens]|nr:GNAT family N-acetyltransferase [Clostridium perfringens]
CEKLALSMTTMTHPDFAGKGFFTKLANGVYEKMKESNYKTVLGFPNVNSHIGFVKKLGWKDIYEIPTLKLNLDNVRITDGSDFNIIEDNSFELDYSELLNNGNKINIYSNNESLIWRFKNNPINKYKNYVISKDGKALASIITKEFN